MDVRPRWQRRRRRPGGERGDGGRRAALVRHRRRPVRDRAHPVGRGPRTRRQRLGRVRFRCRRDARRGSPRDAAAPRRPQRDRARVRRRLDAAARATRLAAVRRDRRAGDPPRRRRRSRPARCCARRSPCSTTPAAPRFVELAEQASATGRDRAPAGRGAHPAGDRPRRSRRVLRRGVRRRAARAR